MATHATGSGRVYWITGLSGSGKTTIAHGLEAWLKRSGTQPIMLDGDAIRDLLLEPMGHDRATRLKIAGFNARLCRFLALQGLIVICPTISMFREVREWNRQHVPGYVEIFLDASLDTLRRRDPKGIYRRYDSGELHEVVGLDIAAEFPERPDIHIVMDADKDVESCLSELINGLRERPA
jgi:adenylylsulfate kinase